MMDMGNAGDEYFSTDMEHDYHYPQDEDLYYDSYDNHVTDNMKVFEAQSYDSQCDTDDEDNYFDFNAIKIPHKKHSRHSLPCPGLPESDIILPYMDVKFAHQSVRIELRSGSCLNVVDAEYALQVGFPVQPVSDETMNHLKDVLPPLAAGEVHVTLIAKGSIPIRLYAIVVKDHGTQITGGMPFLKDNAIAIDIVHDQIIIADSTVICYGNQNHVEVPRRNKAMVTPVQTQVSALFSSSNIRHAIPNARQQKNIVKSSKHTPGYYYFDDENKEVQCHGSSEYDDLCYESSDIDTDSESLPFSRGCDRYHSDEVCTGNVSDEDLTCADSDDIYDYETLQSQSDGVESDLKRGHGYEDRAFSGFRGDSDARENEVIEIDDRNIKCVNREHTGKYKEYKNENQGSDFMQYSGMDSDTEDGDSSNRQSDPKDRPYNNFQDNREDSVCSDINNDQENRDYHNKDNGGEDSVHVDRYTDGENRDYNDKDRDGEDPEYDDHDSNGKDHVRSDVDNDRENRDYHNRDSEGENIDYNDVDYNDKESDAEDREYDDCDSNGKVSVCSDGDNDGENTEYDERDSDGEDGVCSDGSNDGGNRDYGDRNIHNGEDRALSGRALRDMGNDGADRDYKSGDKFPKKNQHFEKQEHQEYSVPCEYIFNAGAESKLPTSLQSIGEDAPNLGSQGKSSIVDFGIQTCDVGVQTCDVASQTMDIMSISLNGPARIPPGIPVTPDQQARNLIEMFHVLTGQGLKLSFPVVLAHHMKDLSAEKQQEDTSMISPSLSNESLPPGISIPFMPSPQRENDVLRRKSKERASNPGHTLLKDESLTIDEVDDEYSETRYSTGSKELRSSISRSPVSVERKAQSLRKHGPGKLFARIVDENSCNPRSEYRYGHTQYSQSLGFLLVLLCALFASSTQGKCDFTEATVHEPVPVQGNHLVCPPE